MTKQQLYEEAMDNFRFESSVFRIAQADYRSRKIGDADFLAARARFDAAMKVSDDAEFLLLSEEANGTRGAHPADRQNPS